MNKQDIYNFLSEKNIEYKSVEHPAAYTVEDIVSFNLPNPEDGAKNLFLRDDKKRNYYLLVAKDDRQINIKEFQQKAGTKHLSFASENDLMDKMGLIRGAVTPFGVLNDNDAMIQVYIDDYFVNRHMWIHPNDNTASVYIKAEDLVNIIKEHGNSVEYIKL